MPGTNVLSATPASPSIPSYGDPTLTQTTITATLDVALQGGESLTATSADPTTVTASVPVVVGTQGTFTVNAVKDGGPTNVTVAIAGGLGGGTSQVVAVTTTIDVVKRESAGTIRNDFDRNTISIS